MSFDKDAFAALTAKTHTEQGIWILNGFWGELEEKAEDVWNIVHMFLEVQLDRKVRYGKKLDVFEEESDLEEHRAHRLLELMGETQTVMALRKRLSALDIDNNHRMAIAEFLLDRYKKTPTEVVDSPQGTVDPAKLAVAQEACDAAAEASGNAADEAAAAAKALEASIKAAEEAAEAKKNAEDALAASEAATAKVKAAEAELQASIDEISALEKAKTDKIAKCQAIIDDPSTGVVKKGRAASEKEQILAEDPLPLRKAKITQQAALKKVTKARVIAEEEEAKSKAAAEAAAAAKEAADAAAKAAEEAKNASDEAQKVAEATLVEAQNQLNELKKGGGTPNGKIWWMERVLTEKRKFMR